MKLLNMEMHNIIFLIITCIIFVSCEDCNKSKENISVIKIFDNAIPTDISFANKNVGYISGGFEINTGTAVIAKTIDGGNTWKVIPVYIDKSPSTVIGNIFAKSSDFIYATYTNSRDDRRGVCFSKDGGDNWVDLGNFKLGGAYSGIYFKTSQIGFVCTSGDVLRTQNGGQNWDTVYNYDGFGGAGRLFFTSDKVGYAYGGFAGDHGSFGTLLKTIDGGNTWIEMNYLSEFINCLSFINDQTGYAFTYDNNIYKTTNGGETWVLLNNFNGLGASYYAAVIKNKVKYFSSGFTIFSSVDDFKTIEPIYKDTLSNVDFSLKAVQPSDKCIFILSSKQSVIKITL